jgi:hypothetical protein
VEEIVAITRHAGNARVRAVSRLPTRSRSPVIRGHQRSGGEHHGELLRVDDRPAA